MGAALGIVIFFVLIGVVRALLGMPSSHRKSDHYNDRDYS
ncbi:hypothetical protein SAMN05192559_10719 [Halobacillus karajensis]|uniref:Uncharacterized protein n=1 Tax=Halobacillus karajensis TaxID=195088 RepID=A0A024P996_9BACI|nr:hypothetical protein BN982_02385 [Halobacillus karajensis]CDQ25266.1 hypothetical protein BN983_03580 [Halobacillus karajensis]CDQ28373.1 hypothetical protein BN981_02672 [Halobacillus karajensis]SEI00190.1 hypothetical protein SAMN05192559_10719 [Halobacillus karajensis]